MAELEIKPPKVSVPGKGGFWRQVGMMVLGTSESTTDSRYVSFGLTWRLGRTEMEAQQTHGKKEPRKKGK